MSGRSARTSQSLVNDSLMNWNSCLRTLLCLHVYIPDSSTVGQLFWTWCKVSGPRLHFGQEGESFRPIVCKYDKVGAVLVHAFSSQRWVCSERPEISAEKEVHGLCILRRFDYPPCWGNDSTLASNASSFAFFQSFGIFSTIICSNIGSIWCAVPSWVWHLIIK